MVMLHETQVDGVRCFWVETGRPTLLALLSFRFGMVDEPLTEQGFQHLIEHLALNGRAGGELQVNGQVSLMETVFQSHGPAERVSAHLSDLTAWLAHPTFQDLDRERRVLQAEASLRPAGPSARALAWRYGARGPGVVAYSDVGLGRADPARLAARAARVFTAGNAVLMLDGPPPPGLQLRLPPGEQVAVPPAVPCEEAFPALYVDDAGLTLSGVVKRSVAMGLATELLSKELADRLRHQDGNAYAPWASYERVDLERAVIIGASDVQPAAYPTLLNDALGLMRHLRTYRPDEQKVTELKALQVQGIRDPYAQFGVAVRAGVDAFLGRPAKQRDEIVEEIEAVTTSEVLMGFKDLHASLLVGVPGDTTYAHEIPRLEAPTNAPRVRGKRWRSVNWPADRSRLRISDDEVEISGGNGVARTLLHRNVTAVLAHENGLRHLIPADGYAISVNPHAWRRGSAAVARLDDVLSTEVQLPQAPVEGLELGVRMSAWRRWSSLVIGPLRSRLALTLLLLVLGAALWIGWAAAMVKTGEGSWGPWGLLGGLGIYLLARRHDD